MSQSPDQLEPKIDELPSLDTALRHIGLYTEPRYRAAIEKAIDEQQAEIRRLEADVRRLKVQLSARVR